MSRLSKSSFIIPAALFLFVTANIVSAQTEESQGWKFASLTAGSGESTISSGISGTLEITHARTDDLIEVTVQQEEAWALYGWKLDFWRVEGHLALGIGHQQGAPWIGPRLTLDMPLGKIAGRELTLSTLQWSSLYPFWEPREWKDDGTENPEPVYLGYIGVIQLNIGPVGLFYARQNFLDLPWNSLPGFSLTQGIGDFTITGSATRNTNGKRWMFYIGATWKPGN